MGWTILLGACLPFAGPVTVPPPEFPASDAPAACTVSELSRQRLLVEGGRPLYVEPDAFAANGRGEALLAGKRSLLWTMGPTGEISGVTADSIFGVVISADGTSSMVPSPVAAHRIRSIRLAARDDHSWDAVFAEASPASGAPSDSASRLWYGVFDGNRWAVLEAIPLPEAVPLDADFSSQLVRRGDSLFWAVRPSIRFLPKDIILFSRTQGRWSHEAIPTWNALDLDLTSSDTSGLLLTVVQADTTLPADGNSLILWAQRPAWHAARRLVHGYVDGPANDPRILRTVDGLIVSWETSVTGQIQGRRELRAMVGFGESLSPPTIPLDLDVSPWSDQPVFELDGTGPVWVSHHMSDNVLRFLMVAGDSASELGRIPNPYHIRMAATKTGSDELLLTGLEYTPDRYGFSLLLRLRVECRGPR